MDSLDRCHRLLALRKIRDAHQKSISMEFTHIFIKWEFLHVCLLCAGCELIVAKVS